MTRLYTTRRDAEQETRAQLPDASTEFQDLVSDQAWSEQQTIADAVTAVYERGIDCEGYEK